MTVQDHRFFCPGRGKWTSDGRVCGDAIGREVCAGCFDDPGYFESTLGLTAQRLESVKRLRLTVLSSYMKRELTQAGVAADRITVVPPVVHGLDPDARADGPPCVLFAGRVVEAKGNPRRDRGLAALWLPAALRRGRHRPLAPRDRGGGCRGAGLARPPAPLRRLPPRRRARHAFALAGALRHRRARGPDPRHAGRRVGQRRVCASGTPVATYSRPGAMSRGSPGALRIAPGHGVDPPRGFEPEVLVRGLEAVYGGHGPSPLTRRPVRARPRRAAGTSGSRRSRAPR